MTVMPKIQDFDDPSFDPFAAAAVMSGDATAIYAVLAGFRRPAPVLDGNIINLLGASHTPTQPNISELTVMSFDLVNQVMMDADTYSQRAYLDIVGQNYGPALTSMDPPEHPRYRRILQKAFLPQ